MFLHPIKCYIFKETPYFIVSKKHHMVFCRSDRFEHLDSLDVSVLALPVLLFFSSFNIHSSWSLKSKSNEMLKSIFVGGLWTWFTFVCYVNHLWLFNISEHPNNSRTREQQCKHQSTNAPTNIIIRWTTLDCNNFHFSELQRVFTVAELF